ncbi:MAG: type II toxin-antitoxin system RelE/ParE family toxin [Desulfobacteraceae bacterium]|nr:MAG: type II toxin-antitoxin system RelE/ParE family toxin [Desulfobacteraceae bacterium]
MYEILWKPKARKQLNRINSQHDREAVYDAVGSLADWPVHQNVKRLMNHKYGYRLRVGRYRVLFDVHGLIRIVEIQEVKKRDEHTY